MINLIQPITVQQAYDGITHARREHHEIGDGGWLDDDDGDGFPSPEPERLQISPPRDWACRRLRIVKRDESSL